MKTIYKLVSIFIILTLFSTTAIAMPIISSPTDTNTTLTTNAKIWLAQHAGTNNCFAGSGVVYTDVDGISHTGRTGDIVGMFWIASAVNKVNEVVISNTTYAQFKVINNNTDVIFQDIAWAYTNDGGYRSTGQYCYTPPKIVTKPITRHTVYSSNAAVTTTIIPTVLTIPTPNLATTPNLTVNGKNYIAQHFGTNSCFASKGVSYKDPIGGIQLGDTMGAVTTISIFGGTGMKGETAADIQTANGGNIITSADINWIGANGGSPFGNGTYCIPPKVVRK